MEQFDGIDIDEGTKGLNKFKEDADEIIDCYLNAFNKYNVELSELWASPNAVKYNDNISYFDSAEKIKEYAKYILISLNIIRNLSGESFIDDAEVIKDIYQVAYEVMKIEVLKTGRSTILKSISTIEKTYIDEYIKEELKSIPDEKYEDIGKRIFELNIETNILFAI